MVSNDNAFGSFLASRRAKVSPEQVGLPGGGNRRVPGLRRTELALLAGISVEYLARLERGVVQGVSESVLDSLAGALQLDDAEHDHLLDLARAITTASRPTRKRRTAIRASIQLVLDSIDNAPAFVRNGRADILAINSLGRALYSEMFVQPGRQVNHARFIFLDPLAHTFYLDWNGAANDIVAILRTKPAAIRSTAISPTSSASCRPGVTNSAPGGPNRTCAATTAAPNTSTIPWSETSTLSSKP